MPTLHGVKLAGPLGKFTWRMLAAVLAGQGIVISLGALVARGIAVANDQGNSTTLLWLGLGLAGLCLVTAGLMRTAIGLPLGWACQVLTLATAYVVPMMFVVGLLFLALWVTCLVQGKKVETMMAEREAAAESIG